MIYDRAKDIIGISHQRTLVFGFGLAVALSRNKDQEAMTFLRELQPIMRQGLGINHLLTLKLDTLYGEIIYNDRSSTRADLAAAVPALKDVVRRSKRVLGAAHPSTITSQRVLMNLKKWCA